MIRISFWPNYDMKLFWTKNILGQIFLDTKFFWTKFFWAWIFWPKIFPCSCGIHEYHRWPSTCGDNVRHHHSTKQVKHQLGLNHVCVILSRRRDTITSAWYYVCITSAWYFILLMFLTQKRISGRGALFRSLQHRVYSVYVQIWNSWNLWSIMSLW